MADEENKTKPNWVKNYYVYNDLCAAIRLNIIVAVW